MSLNEVGNRNVNFNGGGVNNGGATNAAGLEFENATGIKVCNTEILVGLSIADPMRETVKIDGANWVRMEFATDKLGRIFRQLLPMDPKSGADLFLFDDNIEDSKRIKSEGAIDNIVDFIRPGKDTARLECIIDKAWERHLDFCNDNENHQLTSLYIVCSGETHTKGMFTNAYKAFRERLFKCASHVAGEPETSKQFRVSILTVGASKKSTKQLKKIDEAEGKNKPAKDILVVRPLTNGLSCPAMMIENFLGERN